ncbi:MAG TPA: hypothetical protein VFC67_08195 [Prolixibacteraceae bacterium]|nr:hypothetical protein [Prolixibacteraceae bacterium]
MEKKPRKARTPITQQFMEKIVRDHHDDHMSFLQLSHKYKCCFQTVKNICEKNAYGFWNNPAELAKGTVKQFRPVSDERQKLTTQERMKLLVSDAMEVTELTMQQMKIKLMNDDCDLSASQLATFVAAVAPFAIAKKSGEGKKDKGKEVPKSDVFNMFKQQVNNSGKVEPTQRY